MQLPVSGDTGAGKLALNNKIVAGGEIIPLFSLILSAGGEPSVLVVADTVGNVSFILLLKMGLAHTAEAVLAHGSVVEDEEYLDPLSCYTNASDMLNCLNIEYAYVAAPAQEAMMPEADPQQHCGCAIMQYSISVEKAELETPGFGCYPLCSLKSCGLQSFSGG